MATSDVGSARSVSISVTRRPLIPMNTPNAISTSPTIRAPKPTEKTAPAETESKPITIAVMVITPQRLLKTTVRRFMTGIGRQRGRFGQSDPMFASNTPLAPPIVHVLETGPKFWRFAATKRQSGTTSASGMTDAPPYRIVAILLIFAMSHSKGHWQTHCAAAIHHPWTRRSRRQISADPAFPTRQV